MSELDRYTCLQVFERLSDYLDRELDPAEAGLVDAHLALCEVCASEYAFEDRLLRGIRSKLAGITAPPELRRRIERLLAGAREDPPRESA